jgi:hypothetical protein
MATKKQIFRRGIEEADWSLICEAYEKIMKETISPPSNEVIFNKYSECIMGESSGIGVQECVFTESYLPIEEDIPEIRPGDDIGVGIGTGIILESPLAENPDLKERENSHERENSPFYIKQGFGNKKQSNNQVGRIEMAGKTAMQNFFVDDGIMFSNEKVTENAKMGTSGLIVKKDNSRDTRKAVVCSVCGKKEIVASILATTFSTDVSQNTYRCNDCILNRKR